MSNSTHFLVVDDNEADRFLNSRILRKLGVEPERIHAAPDGEEALNILEGTLSDFDTIVLLDINMPIMNGFEFLSRWEDRNSTRKGVKVLMVTSSQDGQDQERAQAFGSVLGYITKPLDRDQFGELIRSLVDEQHD